MQEQERVELINQAIELVEVAQAMVDEAVSNTTNENHYNSYGRYGFDQLLGNGNPYDESLYKLIEYMAIYQEES